jgi:RNase P/RNase MRP subunit POP5
MAKLLKPSSREKNRYLTFEVKPDMKLDRKAVVDAVWSSMIRLHGELGSAKTSLWIMDWDEKSCRGILKANHKSVDLIRAATSLIDEISGKRARINILYVSGTLKKSREKLVV